MSGAPALDPRRAGVLASELERRAVATLSGDGQATAAGQVTQAMLGVAARIGEEVTRRLDGVPAKQEDNFFTAMGLGRDPARPARVPVAFKLADPAPADMVALRGTRLAAETEGAPVTFETAQAIVLAPGAISALAAVDADLDAIYLSPNGVAGGALPRAAPLRRAVRGSAAAGASQVQIDPASGIEKGAVLSLGAGAAAPQYRVTAVEGEFLTIAPPLDVALVSGDPAVEVTEFEPFGGASRDRQFHALYLGHQTLLDVPSKLKITVTGAELPAATVWSWWGKAGEEEAPAWQPLKPEDANGRLQLGKEKGTLVAREIGGKSCLWLRAVLPGPSAKSVKARDIRLAIADAGLCQSEDRCKPPGPMKVDFVAVANTTPIVPNSPFHPFGREPRLFDSFYIGCAEAFSKKHAQISLCIDLGGPKLGPLAGITHGSFQVFGVGTDRMLYRGRFSDGAAQFHQVPRQLSGVLAGQASTAAQLIGETIHVAIGGNGEVQLVSLSSDSNLDPASVTWATLPAQADDAGKPVEQVAMHKVGADPVVYGRIGTRLLRWTRSGDSFQATDQADIAELLRVDGTEILVSIAVPAASKRKIATRTPTDAGWTPLGKVGATALPEYRLAAWTAGSGKPIFFAGYDKPPDGHADDTRGAAQLTLVRVDPGTTATVTLIESFTVEGRLPLLFQAPPATSAGDLPPEMLIASNPPKRFLGPIGAYHGVDEAQPLGASDNPHRHFCVGGGFMAVQACEFGLLYRAPGEVTVDIAALYFEAPVNVLPNAIRFVTYGGDAAGTGYFVPVTGERLLVSTLPPAPIAGPARFYQRSGAAAGMVSLVSPMRVGLQGAFIAGDVDVALFRLNDADNPLAVPDEGIWRLTFSTGTGGVLRWIKPANFPDPTPGDLQYVLLDPVLDVNNDPLETPLSLDEVAEVAHAPGLQTLLDAGPLASVFDPAFAISTIATVDGHSLIAFPHLLIDPARDAYEAKLLAAAARWSWATVGPSQPANPALSWEYWNGESWWALAAGKLRDGTANLLFSGGVFFDAPADIAETEVAGRKNYWIRARLDGGDYGEAKVTSVPHPNTPEPGLTAQSIERDISAIRAPYVMSLAVGFCAGELVRPEIVLTEDSLGTVDRTGANEAGMDIPVFTSAAELMNPLSPSPPAAAGERGACDEPCPLPPAEPLPPDPCDESGAADRCDSPCPNDGEPRADGAAPAPAAAAAFARGLLIGFDKPFKGDPVAIYANVSPGAPPARLRADMLRNGRFEPVNLIEDMSFGLSEPGILLLSFPRPPDEAELAGSPGHWLRIMPAVAGAAWAPQLRGLYLNAVDALSIETRTLETLGHSSGSPEQAFRLSRAPVQPESLTLRVREDVSDEEAAAPGFESVPAIEGMPGPWVTWRASEDLAQEAPDARVFALDPDSGIILFGNGRHGAIPPLGGEIIAWSFAYVDGAAGNKVPAGGTLQLISPLAGVETVTALQAGAGGSDVEAPEAARRRAPAKLRHGDHILTLADLEDFALAYSPIVAQARAQVRGGAVRLIVVAAAADPRPAPALLRALAGALARAGAYGLGRGGGISAVAPVLLPVAVDLTLDPDADDDFLALAKEAKGALAALLDPARGGLDGSGWPLGLLPVPADLSSALGAVAARADVRTIALSRSDGAGEAALPARIAEHVLVTLAAADVRVARARELAR